MMADRMDVDSSSTRTAAAAAVGEERETGVGGGRAYRSYRRRGGADPYSRAPETGSWKHDKFDADNGSSNDIPSTSGRGRAAAAGGRRRDYQKSNSLPFVTISNSQSTSSSGMVGSGGDGRRQGGSSVFNRLGGFSEGGALSSSSSYGNVNASDKIFIRTIANPSPTTTTTFLKPQPQQPTTATIQISNLHLDATQQDIETCFSEFGKIVSANLIKDPITQASLGTCNLTFANRSDAVKAIEKYNQQMADGRLLSVVEITVPVPPASTSIVGASSSQSTSPTSPKTTTVAATAAVSGNLSSRASAPKPYGTMYADREEAAGAPVIKVDTVQPLIQQSVFAKVTSDMFRGGSSSRGRGGSRATTSTPSSSGTVFDRLGGSGGDGAVSTTVFDRLGGKSSSSRNQTTTFTVSI